MSKHPGILLLALMMPLLSLGASVPVAVSDTVRPAASVPDPAGAEVARRVTERWEALIRGDFRRAYALTSPGYRQVTDFDQFLRRYGRAPGWHRVEVKTVELRNPASARVGVQIHVLHPDPATGQAREMSTYLEESWVRVDDAWWYLVRD